MKVIYISSPYTIGDTAQNVAVQMDAAHIILDMGHCPIVPLLSHFLHIYRFRPYEEWFQMDIELLRRSDILLRLPGISIGADKEAEEAKNAGIPVAVGWDQLYQILGED